MSALASLPESKPYPRLRRLALDVAITAVFNFIIALIVTYVLRLHDDFIDNLVISMCIGTLMVVFIDGSRLLLWGLGMPPRLPFALLFLAALPIALYLGKALAALLTGIPVQLIGAAIEAYNPAAFYMIQLFTCLAITWFFWNRGHMELLRAEAEAEKARAAAVERQAMQAQLQLLQAQIEPHMLFNTLANLQGLIALDPTRAQRMLDQLILYLRATLSSSRAQTATLAQEFALLDAYLGLMQVRMGERLRYKLDLPQALHNANVPPMLLQPLVENAIRHGLEPKVDGGTVTIVARQHGALLELCVADTGLGLPAEPVQKQPQNEVQGGIGLANIRARLHALYGAGAQFTLAANEPQGVRAILSLPL